MAPTKVTLSIGLTAKRHAEVLENTYRKTVKRQYLLSFQKAFFHKEAFGCPVGLEPTTFRTTI